MKRIIVCAAALGMLTAAPLFAQNNDQRGERHGNGAPTTGQTAPPVDKPPNNPAPAMTRPDGRSDRNDQLNQNAPRNSNGRQNPNSQPPKSEETHGRPGSTGPRLDPMVNHPNADRGVQPSRPETGQRPPQQNDNRVPSRNSPQNSQNQNHQQNNSAPGMGQRRGDIDSLRRNMQAQRRFHSDSYRPPQGYQTHRWSYGERLPRQYFIRNYWIGNFMMYGLFAPPSDLIWVRVGNDALLVDRYSGDIVQVRYGVFY